MGRPALGIVDVNEWISSLYALVDEPCTSPQSHAARAWNVTTPVPDLLQHADTRAPLIRATPTPYRVHRASISRVKNARAERKSSRTCAARWRPRRYPVGPSVASSWRVGSISVRDSAMAMLVVGAPRRAVRRENHGAFYQYSNFA